MQISFSRTMLYENFSISFLTQPSVFGGFLEFFCFYLPVYNFVFSSLFSCDCQLKVKFETN